jgi:hypothetical protein
VAVEWANKIYGDLEDQDERANASPELRGKWNAFHHAMWMGILGTLSGFSEHDVMLLGAAHELDAVYERIADHKSNRNMDYGSTESEVDMHNNLTGFQIGKAIPGDQLYGLKYIRRGPSEGPGGHEMAVLAHAIQGAVENGVMTNTSGRLNLAGN